jgi:hypothetical protein
MTGDRDLFDWLLDGDVSIEYQTRRDLLGEDRPDLRSRIAGEGWAAVYLSRRHADGTWGRGFYQPKWISSHYSLLDLRWLEIDPNNRYARESVRKILDERKSDDGDINPAETIKESDVCVNGMFLTYACYFSADEAELRSVVDFILDQRMPDGGFNCRKNRSGARHSSVHSTISLLEGIHEYQARGYAYRVEEIRSAETAAREFLLVHRLYKSDRTGEIIHPELLKLTYPPRWKYNILRALVYFAGARVPWDERMRDALDVLLAKRAPDGRWRMQAAHPGEVHLTMERAREPSRWNTLHALRVLRAYGDAAGVEDSFG